MIRKAAFTLIELLAVMAIVTILLGLIVPAVVGTLGGSELTQSSQLFVGRLAYARQTAISINRPIEVRLYNYVESSIGGRSDYRAFQLLKLNENGTYAAVDKIEKLPSAIVISSANKLSSLIPINNDAASLQIVNPAAADRASNLPPTYSYVAFRFMPDGSTNLTHYKSADAANTNLWYLSFCNRNAAGVPPANYATIQIEPASGNVRLYRP